MAKINAALKEIREIRTELNNITNRLTTLEKGRSGPEKQTAHTDKPKVTPQPTLTPDSA